MTSFNVREIPVRCMDCDADLRQRTDWEPVMVVRAVRTNDVLDSPAYGYGEYDNERICYACLDSIEQARQQKDDTSGVLA